MNTNIAIVIIAEAENVTCIDNILPSFVDHHARIQASSVQMSNAKSK